MLGEGKWNLGGNCQKSDMAEGDNLIRKTKR